jgi:hypothetical protein
MVKVAACCTLIVVTLLSLNGSFLFAQRGATVYGFGNESCGSWVTQRTKGVTVEGIGYMNWVLGFVSGYGAGSLPKQLRQTDADAMLVWIDGYCRARPLSSIVEAAAALVTELQK